MVELHDLLTVPALLETVAAYGGYDAVLALHATCRRIRGCTAAILERVGEMAVAGRTFRSLRRRHLKIGFVEGLDIASDSVDQADLQSQFEDGFQQAFETTLDEGSIRGQLMYPWSYRDALQANVGTRLQGFCASSAEYASPEFRS